MSSWTINAEENRLLPAVRLAGLLLALIGGLMVVQAQTAPLSLSQPTPPSVSPPSAVTEPQPSPDAKAPLVVEGSSKDDVFGVARSVVVRGEVSKGVVAFGGDVIVEGKVDGDVAAIGGSVFQRDGSFIGGDVIVLGGAYHHGKNAPGRNPATSTIMFAGYEQELRSLMRDPSSVLTPRFSTAYLGLRSLAILFWFVLSWAVAAITPGAIGRAIVRLRITNLRVAVIGLLGVIVLVLGVGGGLRILPNVIGAMVLLVALLATVLAYIFGRVVIHAATGQWIQRIVLPDSWRSDTWSLLLGAAFWTLVLSLPYLWPIAIIGLLIVGFGICLTGRYRLGWKTPADTRS